MQVASDFLGWLATINDAILKPSIFRVFWACPANILWLPVGRLGVGPERKPLTYLQFGRFPIVCPTGLALPLTSIPGAEAEPAGRASSLRSHWSASMGTFSQASPLLVEEIAIAHAGEGFKVADVHISSLPGVWL